MQIFGSLLLYILAIVAIWFGAGLIISSVEKFSHRLHFSPFITSFVFLGLLTSIPEFGVGTTAIVDGKPEIFVGALIGGIIVMFLFIIPILAILGKGITINHNLDSKKLLYLILILLAPGLFVVDRNFTILEGVLLIACYVLVITHIRKAQVTEKQEENVLSLKIYSILDLAKVASGIGIVFISSQIIVSETIYFAKILNIPEFYLSILVLSLGTNLPELSIALRSVISGAKDIALGNYLGSASANVFLLGLFTIANNQNIILKDSFIITYVIMSIGLLSFYKFSKSKKEISVKEGKILLLIYFSFLISEWLMLMRN